MLLVGMALPVVFTGLSAVRAQNPGLWGLEAELRAVVTVLLSQAECVLGCAEEHPDLGDDYEACKQACLASSLGKAEWVPFFQGAGPSADGGDAAGADAELVDALNLAREIQRLRDDAADPGEIVSALDAFWRTDWRSERVRSGFVRPLFACMVVELSQEWSGGSSGHARLHDLVLNTAHEETLHGASRIDAATRLALALWTADPGERHALQEAVTHHQLVKDVDVLTRAMEVRRAWELMNSGRQETTPAFDIEPDGPITVSR